MLLSRHPPHRILTQQKRHVLTACSRELRSVCSWVVNQLKFHQLAVRGNKAVAGQTSQVLLTEVLGLTLLGHSQTCLPQCNQLLIKTGRTVKQVNRLLIEAGADIQKSYSPLVSLTRKSGYSIEICIYIISWLLSEVWVYIEPWRVVTELTKNH